MKRKLFTYLLLILVSIPCLILKPTYLYALPTRHWPLQHIDWKDLIGSPIDQLGFNHSLIEVPSEARALYGLYQYKNSLIYVCKESNLIHHVTVRDPQIMICNTFIQMPLSNIEKLHGKATAAKQTFTSNEWMTQYVYDEKANYNLVTRLLTYVSKGPDEPIHEINYGYTLPLFPDNIGTITSIREAKKHLQGNWYSSKSSQLILYNNYLFTQFSTQDNLATYNNFFVVSPNEMFITHPSSQKTVNLTSLRFIFNGDYSKLFLFSTDQHGIPIQDTIDLWTRS